MKHEAPVKVFSVSAQMTGENVPAIEALYEQKWCQQVMCVDTL